MKKLHELLKKPLLKEDVGVEIECEGVGFSEVNTTFWHTEDDASLRGRFPTGRAEYVLNVPIKVDQVKEAVNELNVLIQKAKPDFSFRTSVHVHVNVLELTEEQLNSFIYTYLLLEEPLMNFCGTSRKCNRFCLRLQDADASLGYLSKIFVDGFPKLVELDPEQVRYAAINLASVKKYGSVEFRGMRGTLDVNTIDIWCHALVSLRNFACQFTSVLQVHDCYVKRGPEEFFKFVLGDLHQHFKYKNLIQDIQRSYSLSIDLPNLVFNKKSVTKEVKTVKERNPAANIANAIAAIADGMAAQQRNIIFAPPPEGFRADIIPKLRVRAAPIEAAFDDLDDIIEEVPDDL